MKREKPNLKSKLSKKTIKDEKSKIQIDSSADSFLQKKALWVLLILLCLIGFIAFYKYLSVDFLFFFKDIGSDTINQNYPSDIHTYNLLREGFTSKWSFYPGMGRSYVINFPVEPLSWIQLIENRIGMKVVGQEYMIYTRFIHLFIYHFLLTGILFYSYLKTLSISNFVSVIGSISIAFSGYMVLGSSWGFSSQIFKAVFLLFAFEQLYLKKRWYFFPFAVLLLSNNPFVLYIYSIFLLLYSIFRYWQDNKEIKGYLRLAGNMIILGLAGVLMNLVNAFNAFITLYNSPRVAGDASYSQVLSSGEEIYTYTKHWPTLFLRFFSNDILGTGSKFRGWNNYLEAPVFYIGLLPLLLLPQVFITMNKRKRTAFGLFFAFWIITLFLPFLRRAILAFTGDYYRYGFDFFIPFTLLFYAVFALNNLNEGIKINHNLLGVTIILLLILLFFPYSSINTSDINNQVRLILVLFLVGYSGLLILFSIPKYRNYAQIGILLLIFIEFSFTAFKSYEEREPVTKKEFKKNKAGYADGTIEAVNYSKSIDKTPFYRTTKDYNSGSSEHTSLNDAQAQGYYGTASYSSFNQLNYIRFLEETEVIQKGNEAQTRWSPGFKGYPLLQTFGSVKYHLSKSESPLFLKFGFDSIATIDSVKILKNRYYLPFGFTYDKYIDFSDFSKLTPFNKQIALLNGFVYENDEYTHFKPNELAKLNEKDSSIFVDDKGFNFALYKQFTDSLKIDTFAISSFRQDNIKGSISMKKGRVLFFSIPYNEGWKIKVNGKNEILSRINIGFTGIYLPKGDYKLELYFIPKYYNLTSTITWISVAFFWLYLGYYVYVQKKKNKESPVKNQ